MNAGGGKLNQQRNLESKHRIQDLDALLAVAQGEKMPPVEKWDPPYCGGIGMRIRADGIWLYQNSPIGRPASCGS